MKSWQQYTNKANSFFESYIELNFEDIFNDVSQFIPSAGSTCLDIGAGSGRDSAALARKGLIVTAVEPSDGMRELAMTYHKGLDITWINDSLPYLAEVKKQKKYYDFILMSAVWMHLPPEERYEALSTAFKLLNPMGTMILTLRLGPAEPDRIIYEISTEEAISKAMSIGFQVTFVNPIKKDSLKRNNIQWQLVVLNKP